MPFLSLSFSFSLYLTSSKAEPGEPSSEPPAQRSTNLDTPSYSEASTYSSHSSTHPADPNEHLLSPLTQRMQQRIRAQLQAKREDIADAASLLLLLRAEDARQRRETELDAESLAILLRATAEAEEGIPAPLSTGGMSGGSWSSFEDVQVEGTPCPPPKRRLGMSSPPRGVGGAGEVVVEDGGFEESMRASQARRKGSGILQSASRAEYDDDRVDEMMEYYDELMARNPTIPPRDESHSEVSSLDLEV